MSDDQNNVRFYTLTVNTADGSLDGGDVAVSDVMFLQPPAGETYAAGTVDPEGLTSGASGFRIVGHNESVRFERKHAAVLLRVAAAWRACKASRDS